MKKGISLITLIVTIIVVIILAGAVILNLNGTNIIDNAEEAVYLNDARAMQVELELFHLDMYVKSNGSYIRTELKSDDSDSEGGILYIDDQPFMIGSEFTLNNKKVDDIELVEYYNNEINRLYNEYPEYVELIDNKVANIGNNFKLVAIDGQYKLSDIFESTNEEYLTDGNANEIKIVAGELEADDNESVISSYIERVKNSEAIESYDIVLKQINNKGGTGTDTFQSVIKVSDGYIAVGKSDSDLSGPIGGNINTGLFDFVIAKFNMDLSLNKITNIGGTDYDYLESVIEVSDGYVAVGKSKSDLSGLTGGENIQGDYDFVIVKFNKDLSLNKLNNLGGSDIDSLNSVIEVNDGYVAVGRSKSDLSGDLMRGNNSQGNDDFVIVKFNKDLSLNKLNNLGGTSYDNLRSVIQTNDGYIAVGCSNSDLNNLNGGNLNLGVADFVIAKFNTDLSLNKITNIGGTSYDYFNDVIEVDDGYVVIGNSSSDLSGDLTRGNNPEGAHDLVIAKFNIDLSFNKLNNIGGLDNELIYSIIETSDGYIVAGKSRSDLSELVGGENTQGSDDFVIAKFSKDLSLNKLNNLGGNYGEVFYSVIQTNDGFIGVGQSSSDLSGLTGGSISQSTDFVIVKFGNE